MLSVLFFVRVPAQPFKPGLVPEDTTSEAVYSTLQWLHWQMALTHIICFVSIALPQQCFEKVYNACSFLVVFAMGLEVMLITKIFDHLLVAKDYNSADMTLGYVQFTCWL